VDERRPCVRFAHDAEGIAEHLFGFVKESGVFGEEGEDRLAFFEAVA
jgi:hypothetical protein